MNTWNPFAVVPLEHLLAGWEEGPGAPPDEGWGLFESDTYGWEVEADADSDLFVRDGVHYDDEAVAFVRGAAKAGSNIHQLALAIHEAQEAENRTAAQTAGYEIRAGFSHEISVGLAWGYVRPGELSVNYTGRTEIAAWSAAFRDAAEKGLLDG